MAVTATQVQSLYLAYFGRPAEQAGLTYWTAQADATVDQISAAFAQQPEYTAVYNGLTRSQTIETLYQNLFGRAAASNELSYWLNSTDVNVPTLALALVNGATGTDRLLLDNKAQYAAAVTANAGADATAQSVEGTYDAQVVNGQTLSAYVSAQTAANSSVTASQATAQFYALAAATVKAETSPIYVASTATPTAGQTKISATPSVDFKGLSTGTITLNAVDLDSTLTLAGANATSLTVQGSVAASTANTAATGQPSNAAETDLAFTATAANTQFNTLNLNLSSAGTTDATKLVGIDVTGLTELTSINGASSSAGLVITGTTASANLASVTTGSGADNVTVATTATKAVAQTVDTGAGNDTISGTVGSANLTINAGAGNDNITVKAGAAALVVNAGDGNDTVTLGATGTVASTVTAAHTSVISLGAGNDVVSFANTVANIQNYTATTSSSSAADVTAADNALKAGLITISDFNTATDTLSFTGTGNTVATLTNAQIGAINSATSLSAAVQLVAGDLGGKGAAAFQYGSDTYVFVDATGAGTVDSGDALIQLSGVTATQLTSTNFTHA
ncbi:DUF4214 domain-containing protein [Pseudomonas benzopyrenica]|uniref:DUF4214 domain-containing protein n=1 Tax=Pseudomonas benzopyrenica TaxID=2993566 RepID=UPI003F184232